MEPLQNLIARWRAPRPAPTGEAPATAPRGRWRRTAGVIAFLALLGTAGVIVALRANDAPPKPEPAVPAGQLARELEAAGPAASSGVVAIDAETAERLGLQTAVVAAHAVTAQVQTTGRVVPDERRITRVTTKYDGWVEQTFGNFEGQEIRAGQPLFTVYSPELVATAQEYLLALRAQRGFATSEFAEVRGSGEALIDVARQRLRLFDVSAEQIAELERTGKVPRSLTVYAPATGVITERKAFPGTKVSPDMDLYVLSDLSLVWVEADVFESDLGRVRVGTPAEVTLPDGQIRRARVTYVNPVIVPETRTARVRLELTNPRLALMPGMFVTVSFVASGEPALLIPRDAVLDTGVRRLVLVQEAEGRFRLREIRTGEKTGDAYPVLAGLAPGDRVARNAQFLVESETPLREAVQHFAPPASGDGAVPGQAPAAPGHAGHHEPEPNGGTP